MERFYKIAGLTVKMDPVGVLEKRAEKYLCSEAEEFHFLLKSSWDKVKSRHPELDDDMGEYISTGFNFYKKLLEYNGIMLHSSVVGFDGKAYLFTADSGVGKSTHTKLWLELLGDRAFILNDDKPALRFMDGEWFAFGTPWSGKHDISENIGLPIEGIAVLSRGEENKITLFNGREAVKLIIKQTNRPKKKEDCEIFLQLLEKLFTEIPVWKLECNTSLEAAEIAYKAMTGNNKD